MEYIQKDTHKIYDGVRDYNEGRAVVRINWKYGVIDLDGNEVVPLKYDLVERFSEGRAGVKLNDKYGVIDSEGNEVLPCWYDSVYRLTDGFKTMHQVSTHNIEYLYFDMDGNQITEPRNN
jgi:hypothetical protein